MSILNMSPIKPALGATLWETGRATLNPDADDQMPLVVISTSACASLNSALTAEGIEGDVRYLHALPHTAQYTREVPVCSGAAPIPVATVPVAGLVFVAVDPHIESDLVVALSVSRVAREAGLFVVALVAQADSSHDARVREGELLLAFDSVIALRAAWPEAQPHACKIIKHLAGGLKVAPPVCTDLADVQGILGGAIVTVGVGESAGSTSADEMGRAWNAAARAIEDAGCSSIAAATGVIIAIAGNQSVRLSEISRVTHQVGDLVKSASAFVIPTVHVEARAPDRFRVLLLVAQNS